MELPHLGEQCTNPTCNQLDYLPLKCDACKGIFCKEHVSYQNHGCPSAYKKDVQVPVCPLCNIPIPVKRGEQPDIAVGAHIDSDCQSDPAKNKRKVFINKCSVKNCRIKEVVPVLCNDCKLNFCLKHRHPNDHKCEGAAAASRRRAAEAATSRLSNASGSSGPTRTQTSKTSGPNLFHRQQRSVQTQPAFSSIQGSLSEDEALARALAMSMQDSPSCQSEVGSVDEDLMLARAIAESERLHTAQQTKSSCNLA